MKVIILFALISLAVAHGRSNEGGLVALTNPAVMGIANPLLSGAGRGVAGAAAGTQQTADLAGEAIEALLHTLGGVLGNVEQGAGVAAANAAPAVQGTVKAVQDNSGLAGDAVRALTGGGH